METRQQLIHLPKRQGLYDPSNEHDACGVGFVAHIKGARSHQILLDAETVLRNMDHRGACGCEANTGDGAGILTALPHEFVAKAVKTDLGVDLPEPGKFAAGNVFLPQLEAERAKCKKAVEQIVAAQGQRLIGWRNVPTETDAADVGPTARQSEPVIQQLVIAAADGVQGDAFERQLYLIRKQASNLLRADESMQQAKMFYICSLSTKVIIYKGMLITDQLFNYFPDLADASYTSHLAMVHSRFATNTFPSWDRAQPCRFMSHNGEINTVRGNKNWMFAPSGSRQERSVRRRACEAVPNCRARLQRLGDVRQRAGILADERPHAARSRDDDDSRGMAKPRQHARREARVLRVSLGVDGTVGRPRFGRVHRRQVHRRGARSQRPATFAVLTSRTTTASSWPAKSACSRRSSRTTSRLKGRLQPGRMFLVDFEQGTADFDDDDLKSRLCR